MKPIDLRSDTVTRPSPGMRKAMADAEVGDDVYGEDPTVRKLEERTAELLGHPAGVFVSSGTLGNELGIGVLTRPGDEVITEAGSHCVNFEAGAMSALWGVQPRTIEADRGLLSAEQVTAAVRPADDHLPPSRLLCLENTHNRGGGAVWPLERYRQVVTAGRRAGLKVHLDGARLFNAQVASGVKARAYAELADTATVCFSKGLGAPVGSVLCGGVELLREARRLRKRLGGGMRQAGILAAAALYALDHNVERLAEDHQNAKRLAAGLAALPGVHVDVARVETNMVFADFSRGATDAVARLKARGVLANAEGSRPSAVRFVCHLDVSAADIDAAVSLAREAL
jgi:threonine aldolase